MFLIVLLGYIVLHAKLFFLLYEAIGLLMQNTSVNVQTDVTNMYKKDFSQYSRTYAAHCVQDVEWYKAPTAISEISVTSCQGKGLNSVMDQLANESVKCPVYVRMCFRYVGRQMSLPLHSF